MLPLIRTRKGFRSQCPLVAAFALRDLYPPRPLAEGVLERSHIWTSSGDVQPPPRLCPPPPSLQRHHFPRHLVVGFSIF